MNGLLDEVVSDLTAAVRALADGHIAQGRDLLARIDRDELLARKSASHLRAKAAIAQAGWTAPASVRKRSDPSEAVKQQVYRRDQWICRWAHCQRRTIAEPVLRLASAFAPAEFPHHPNWRFDSCHPAYWIYATQLEHIIASTAGGSDDVTNLQAVCSECQYAKGAIGVPPLFRTGWVR